MAAKSKLINKAVLREDFTCCPNGIHPVTFAKGETVTGEVARWAKAEGLIVSKLVKDKPANKAIVGPAPENK